MSLADAVLRGPSLSRKDRRIRLFVRRRSTTDTAYCGGGGGGGFHIMYLLYDQKNKGSSTGGCIGWGVSKRRGALSTFDFIWERLHDDISIYGKGSKVTLIEVIFIDSQERD